MKRLRILYVSPCEPVSEGSGSQQRSFVAVQALRQLGEVWHLSVPPDGEPAAPNPLFAATLLGATVVAAQPALWQGLVQPSRWRTLLQDSWVTAGRMATPSAAQTAALVQQVRTHLGPEPFDVIYAFQAHAGAFVDGAFSALLAKGGLSVVDWDAAERPGVAEQSRQREGGASPKAAIGRTLNDIKLGRTESRLLARTGLTLCASDVDVAYFQQRRPGARVHAVPNCVHLPSPPMAVQAQPGHRVLFVGLINYWPNRQGLLHFLQHIWPGVRQRLPDAQFRIVGRGVTPDVQAHHGQNGVDVVGPVDHVRPHYEWCDVAVAPMLFSVGSSIKILEALAYLRPVVAYEAATRRHALVPGVEIGSAADPTSFHAQLLGLLLDPAQARQVAEAGFRKVAEHYGRVQVMDRINAAIEAALERPNPG